MPLWLHVIIKSIIMIKTNDYNYLTLDILCRKQHLPDIAIPL
jgi:hypothetical protein